MQATVPTQSATSPVVWETVRCPLCRGGDEETVLVKHVEPEGIACRLARCRSCRLVYLNPRPTAETIGYFYPDDYEAYRAPKESTSIGRRLRNRIDGVVYTERLGYPGSKSNWLRRLAARAAATCFGPSRASHTSIPFHGEGRLLDVGCGGGWLAHRMRQRGWQVTGLDFSRRAIELMRQNYGLPGHVGTLPHPAIAPRSFDVVNMGAVLEHVHDPRATIAAAREALTTGGLLVLSVPNLDSWGFRHFGEDWHPLCLPHHLLHFTPETLGNLLKREGFAVNEMRIVGRASWMRRSVMLRENRLGLGSMGRMWKWRPVPSLATSWSIRRGQGDCLFVIAQRQRKKS